MQKSVRIIAVSRFLGLLFSIVSIFYSYSDFGNSVLSDSLIVCNSDSGRRFSKFGIVVIDWERLKVISILLEKVCRSSCWVRRQLIEDHNKVPWFAEFSFGLIKGCGFGGFRQSEDCRLCLCYSFNSGQLIAIPSRLELLSFGKY